MAIQRPALAQVRNVVSCCITDGGRAKGESHIYLDNTSDGYVWVTAYRNSDKTTGAWCVAPHTFDKHGLRVPTEEVRFEISRGRCQGHPVLFNKLRGFPFGEGSQRMTYYVHGANGNYWYGNY